MAARYIFITCVCLVPLTFADGLRSGSDSETATRNKRMLDPIGDSLLKKRMLDPIGGGLLRKRMLDSIGDGLLKKRMLDPIGDSLLKKRMLDSIGSSLIKKRMLDHIGAGLLKKRMLDPIGQSLLKRSDQLQELEDYPEYYYRETRDPEEYQRNRELFDRQLDEISEGFIGRSINDEKK